MDQVDLRPVEKIVQRLGGRPETLIATLQAIQSHYKYLPPEALERVCELTRITPAAIVGVSTFYTQFRHRPLGKHVIRVCHGTACHVKGSETVHRAIVRQLGIAEGEDTDRNRVFTVQKVACLGCCTLAPVVQIDDVTYGRLTPAAVAEAIEGFLANEKNRSEEAKRRVISSSGQPLGEIRIGLGSCCVAQGGGDVRGEIERVLYENSVSAHVKPVGCVGMCHQTPLLELVSPNGDKGLYSKVQVSDVSSIVLEKFRPKGLRRRITRFASSLLDRFLTDEFGKPGIERSIDSRDDSVCAFLECQKRIATEDCGQIDPTDIDEYQRHDGFVALDRCCNELSSPQIISEIELSRLRGRGGAGFPTGAKWAKVCCAPGQKKYVICNGDEGDPGAFMDRMILESFPFRVIEGMAIAARAVGADEGFLYIRAEYSLAVRKVEAALQKCRQRGLLDGFSLSVKEGAGAFICGEETAMLASLEGGRGMPRLRPPFPAERGLWGRPTLVNNVESFAMVPWIIRNGAEAFANLGTGKSKGTKVFALAGKVRRGGLIEVPMGVSLSRIVHEIGGGISGGKTFKAVQVGGPSGGCVPAKMADTPVDYEALKGVGAIMGSGGLVVLDESDCMVDIAKYFLRFTQDQSCGKCTLCRVGTRRMLDILDRICTGEGKGCDLGELERLAVTVAAGSVCGLGRTAPNSVLSTLKYFRHEYEAHLDGRCPAGKCRDLITYRVTNKCIGCTLCAQHCPVGAIAMRPYEEHSIDSCRCTRCGTCLTVCPEGAVVVE